ncbi:MAG: response regulator [Candidatus Hydrogenedens sp.]|nr:response regulator [Candidatus Hydrogenedens sp.]
MAFNFLVVDDSETARAVVVKILRLSGVAVGEVHEASNGVEALQLLEVEPIDALLTDINMPEMNGAELIATMQQDERLAAIPVLVISTEGSQTRVEHLLQEGVRAYLRKPFPPEKLREALEGLLPQ